VTPSWRLLLGGMIVWIIHFATVYGASLIWGSGWPAKLILGATTLAALAALGWLVRRLIAWQANGFDRWMREVALLLIGVGFVSILWQAAPALFS
jgi:hypothetical protein